MEVINGMEEVTVERVPKINGMEEVAVEGVMKNGFASEVSFAAQVRACAGCAGE